jgi:hypothetical protein
MYDSAGNLIAAPPTGTTYTYDAENRLISTGGQTYLYDGDGKRVEKASGSPLTANKIYWYGTDSNPVIETDASGNELDRYFYFAGRLVNREEANDAVDHYASDALGNIRYVYGSAGAPDRSDYYPFGGERVYQSQANSHYNSPPNNATPNPASITLELGTTAPRSAGSCRRIQRGIPRWQIRRLGTFTPTR